MQHFEQRMPIYSVQNHGVSDTMVSKQEVVKLALTNDGPQLRTRFYSDKLSPRDNPATSDGPRAFLRQICLYSPPPTNRPRPRCFTLIMSALRLVSSAVRRAPKTLALGRRGYAEAADKIKLSLVLPHQVRHQLT